MPFIPPLPGPATVSQSKFYVPERPLWSATQTFVDEEGGDWWSGVWQYGASVALAATLALTSSAALSQQVANQWQDEAPTPVTAQAADTYWYSPGTQAVYPLPPQVFTDDQVIVPQPVAFMPDEDFWSPPLPPQPGISYPQPWTWDDQTPLLHGQPDEDYWQNPTAPIPATLRPLDQSVFDDQYPVLYAPPDELYWQNQVFPVPYTLYQPLPLVDTDQYPVLYGQYDEDFWSNPVPSVQATLLWPDPARFDEQYPLLHGMPDEDFWQPSVTAAPAYQSLLLWPDSDIPQSPAAFVPDEDFWQPPYQQQSYQTFLYLPDADQFVPGPILPVFEDEPWVTFQQTVAIANIGLPVWAFEGDLVVTAGPPVGMVLDERISYDRYGAGEYLTGYTQIGNDL